MGIHHCPVRENKDMDDLPLPRGPEESGFHHEIYVSPNEPFEERSTAQVFTLKS